MPYAEDLALIFYNSNLKPISPFNFDVVNIIQEKGKLTANTERCSTDFDMLVSVD